jgi:hypothetical protein
MSSSIPKWSEVNDPKKLKEWLSNATITKTYWGGRAFKTSSDKTGVNLNVVFAKLQKLLKQNPTPQELKEIVKHFLKHDFTPPIGYSKEKALYLSRFLGNKQTAKRNNALTELIKTHQETADELFENQIFSQGLKTAFAPTNVAQLKLSELYDEFAQNTATPHSVVTKFQKVLDTLKVSHPPGDQIEQKTINAFVKFLEIKSGNSVFLRSLHHTLSNKDQQSPRKCESYDQLLSTYTSKLPRSACQSLGKIAWHQATPSNTAHIKDACQAISTLSSQEIKNWYNGLQDLKFNESNNKNVLNEFLSSLQDSCKILDELAYGEATCLKEAVKTLVDSFQGTTPNEETALYDALTNPQTTPDQAAKAFRKFLNTISARIPLTPVSPEVTTNFCRYLNEHSKNSVYLQGIAEQLSKAPEQPVDVQAEPVYNSASRALEVHASHFPRQALLDLSKIKWGEDVTQQQGLIESACTAMKSMHPIDIQTFYKQGIEFDESAQTQKKNFEAFRQKLEEEFGNSFVNDETEYQESACLREGLRTFCSECDMKEADFNSLYDTLTRPNTKPIDAVRKLNMGAKKTLNNFKVYLQRNGQKSLYLQGIVAFLENARMEPNWNPEQGLGNAYKDFREVLTKFSGYFSRETSLALSKVKWDTESQENEDLIRKACTAVNTNHRLYVEPFYKTLKALNTPNFTQFQVPKKAIEKFLLNLRTKSE